jgi:hypothetical protein
VSLPIHSLERFFGLHTVREVFAADGSVFRPQLEDVENLELA